MSDLEKTLQAMQALVDAAGNELVQSRDRIRMLEEEVSFIRGKLPERDRHIDVLRGDIQRQAGCVKRLIEERDEARKLLAEVTQERDHWLGKCRDHGASTFDSEAEVLAMHIYLRMPGIEPPLAFVAAERFLAERDSRRKKAEATNEN